MASAAQIASSIIWAPLRLPGAAAAIRAIRIATCTAYTTTSKLSTSRRTDGEEGDKGKCAAQYLFPSRGVALPMLTAKDLKHYPHFDRKISLKEANALVSDPERVARHKFYPFFLYNEEWQPFRTKKDASTGKIKRPAVKSRPIRYASRKDAYILTYYRRILSEKYESRLDELGISECPIAYRKIAKVGGGGKCNIDFAKDAFDFVESAQPCVAIALDISKYFENLDHERIKELWCQLLGVDRLPNDHYAIYRNVTDYHVVDLKDVYRRLGFIETITVNGYPRERYTVKYKDMPSQLCSPAEFREKIVCPHEKSKSLVKGNVDESGKKLTHGVPQGAPISDLIANFYLIDFDVALNNYATSLGGRYMRYSDDILLIIPGGPEIAAQAEAFAIAEISKAGSKLTIKPEKTSVVHFSTIGQRLVCTHIRGQQGKNGLEYLGFRFDGKSVYVRESTMSRLYRKVAISAKAVSYALADRYKDKTADELKAVFNFSAFGQRFSRVAASELSPDDFDTWTFYSYLKRSAETFGARGEQIVPQMRNFGNFMRDRAAMAIERAVERRDKPAAEAS